MEKTKSGWLRETAGEWLAGKDNAVVVTRRMGDDTVVVMAQYREEHDDWALSAYINCVLSENRAGTDIWTEIPDMIECAFEEWARKDDPMATSKMARGVERLMDTLER